MIKGIGLGTFTYEDEQALIRTFGEFSLSRYGNTNHWGVYTSSENNQVTGNWLTFMVKASDGWTQVFTLPGTYIIYKDYMDKELKKQIIHALDKLGQGGLIRVADDTAVMEFNPV